MANHILNIPQEGFNEQTADIDGNGKIDVSDYIGVANIIHTGTPYGNGASRAAKQSKTVAVKKEQAVRLSAANDRSGQPYSLK